MDEPRAYTQAEVRDMIIQHCRNVAHYWASLPDVDEQTGRVRTRKDRCDGVAFSILSMLDGCTMDIPAIVLKLSPHEDDKAFYVESGENWFEPGMEISEMLHEHFHGKSDNEG